jgi:hypothetical protein
MRFARGTSYNTHDVSVDITPDRVHITFDTRRRCELALRGILRHGGKGVSTEDLTAHINKRLNCLYSESDIRYVCRRLVTEGLVSQPAKDHFVASPAALAAWRALPKDLI